MKKFLSLVLALIMTMSLVTVSAGAKDFTDDDKLNYEEAVAVMSEIGVIDGYTDGSFKPQNGLTRGAAAKIICNMILGPTTASALRADTAPFKDVPADNQYAGYIAYCVQQGITAGYTDGTYRPAAPLTNFAFMKMLLCALGYDQNTEGYVGGNCFIAVAKQAIGLGLNNGLKEDFDGGKQIKREEAALFAFNTLQATLVEYDEKTTVNVGGAQVVLQGKAQDVKWGVGTLNDGNIKDDGFVQFAEKHFPKLVKANDTDDFMRPAHTWVNDKKEIDTFVDYTKLVETYKKKVTGRDVYDLLKGTVIRENELEAYVDGVENKKITKDDLVRSNTSALKETGTGVLTEIYLDTDKELITIVSVNTYLAQATSDYSEKKEGVTLKVFEKNATGVSKTVALVDVPAIKDVEKDQYYLVNMSGKNTEELEVVALTDVEILTDSTVSKFTQDKASAGDGKVTELTTGGTKYSNNLKAFYDEKVLDNYDASLLTDITYNVYLDPYGNFIGVDVFEGAKNYLFITGYDLNTSNLYIKNADAAAIFPDGSMKVIKVDVPATNKNIDKADGKKDDACSLEYFDLWTPDTVGCVNDDGCNGNRQLNRWYSYTVNDGVYTLKPATRMFASDIAEINPAAGATEATINCSNVRLDATANKDCKTGENLDEELHSGKVTIDQDNIYTRAYGEDASVFITVGADNVGTSKKPLDAITKVNGVYTGVQDVDIEITKADQKSIAHSVYTLFDSDNYIIASIILGDANGAVANYAYILGDVKSEARVDGIYYWEFEVVINGEIETLTAKSKYADTITALEPAHVQELRFDGDYVVEINDVDAKDVYAFNEVRIDKESVYDIGHCADKDKHHDECGMAGKTCPVLNEGNPMNARTDVTGRLTVAGGNYMFLQGRTMYTGADDQGLTFVKDAKAVVIQPVNGKWKNEEYASVPEAVAALADPIDTTATKEFGGRVVAILNAQGVAEWVVIISDTDVKASTGIDHGIQGKVLELKSVPRDTDDGSFTVNLLSAVELVPGTDTADVVITTESGVYVVEGEKLAIAANDAANVADKDGKTVKWGYTVEVPFDSNITATTICNVKVSVNDVDANKVYTVSGLRAIG